LLSPRALRKLRQHQEQFVESLAARLSLHLRLEFNLKLLRLQTITYQKLAQSWGDPTHLIPFKLEPLRGVAILEISSQLGSSLVDRLMGGPGRPPEVFQEISEIEKALLDQTAQILLTEWCAHWAKLKEFKPVLLGYESNGRFIQIAAPETMLLLLSLQVSMGDVSGEVQIGFPFAALQPFIQQLTDEAQLLPAPAAAPATPPPAAAKWNSRFDDLCLPISAEWHGLEISAREILALKVGDVIKMTPQQAEQMEIRIGELPRFTGRPGTLGGQWAVELTQIMARPSE
jgi:flagellar motor switch protein FliM